MSYVVYGDFNCPYSYLASLRVDEVVRRGAGGIEWRAVEHDPRLAVTGTPSAVAKDEWARELGRSVTWRGPGSGFRMRRRLWSATPARLWPLMRRR